VIAVLSPLRTKSDTGRTYDCESELFSAVEEMKRILTELEDCPYVEEETQALRVQLERLETAINEADQDPARTAARKIATQMDLPNLCRDQEMAGLFISELMLQIISSVNKLQSDGRRQHQKQCIEAAKARGVRFGRPSSPLPDNFDEVHASWRSGTYSLRQAAELCGMSKSSFYNAALRAEETAEAEQAGEDSGTEPEESPKHRRSKLEQRRASSLSRAGAG